MGFDQFLTTKKGSKGELVFHEYCRRNGRTPFPVAAKGKHIIDLTVYNPQQGTFTAIDVKAYPRLYSTPMTGLDTLDLATYRKLNETSGLPVWIVFVDVFEQAIYGAAVNDLPEPDRIGNYKSYYWLDRFRLFHRLTPTELKQLGPIKSPDKYKGKRRHF